eukprot:scaffold1501_cov352-Pavlova_lutheri.AAC.47
MDSGVRTCIAKRRTCHASVLLRPQQLSCRALYCSSAPARSAIRPGMAPFHAYSATSISTSATYTPAKDFQSMGMATLASGMARKA